jgi:hypothetical protein
MHQEHQTQSLLWFTAIIEIGRLLPERNQRLFFIRVFPHRITIYEIENLLPTKEWESFINDLKRLQHFFIDTNRILAMNDILMTEIKTSFIIAWNSPRRS